MKNSYKILQQLISLLSDFEQSNPEKTELKDFVSWLNSAIFEDEKNTSTAENQNKMIDMELTHLIIMQNKHFKTYTKQALKNSKISTADDFSFLYHLSVKESFRKMEIINMHQLEAPSGIEVLKRLLKNKFIEEFNDPEDRRAKRIKITEKGKAELDANMENMQKVFQTMPADLNFQQKTNLITLLNQINNFHLKDE